jgi:metal-dependent amidase/aminoacylase/carboxypeptidase family protein
MARKKIPAAEIVDAVPRARPTKRTPEIVEAVIAAVTAGIPLAQVVREHGIGLTTWYDWTYADPALAERIARAREAGEEVIASDALRIVDEPPPSTMQGSTDSGHVAWAKSRAEIRLKLLAKWNPKKWGDKVQAEVTGADGGPVIMVKDFTGRSDV